MGLDRIANLLSPYRLKVNFANRYASVQVVHIPTGNIVSSVNSEEKVLKHLLQQASDVSAAAKIGKLLGERLLLKGISEVSVAMRKGQHDEKLRNVIDAMRSTGVNCRV